jgi:hypothetical protein
MPERLPVNVTRADGFGHNADRSLPQELIKYIVEGHVDQVELLQSSWLQIGTEVTLMAWLADGHRPAAITGGQEY